MAGTFARGRGKAGAGGAGRSGSGLKSDAISWNDEKGRRSLDTTTT